LVFPLLIPVGASAGSHAFSAWRRGRNIPQSNLPA
jgi:hypothetical protein